MSKKENTIGQEFEAFLRVALTQQLDPNFGKRKSKPKVITTEELCKLYKEKGVTEEVFRNYCLFQGTDPKIIEKLVAEIYPLDSSLGSVSED